MEKREKLSKITIVVFLVFFIWILLQFLAPLALTESSITDLSGLSGVVDNEQETKEIPVPWNFIYGCGDRLCHQKVERSFFINGNQMPFCARCTAIWLGLAIGIGFMLFYKIELDLKFIILIFIGLIPIGIDGFGQLFGLWESNNIIRLVTGVLMGIVCGMTIGVIIDEIKLIRSFKKTKNN